MPDPLLSPVLNLSAKTPSFAPGVRLGSAQFNFSEWPINMHRVRRKLIHHATLLRRE